MGIWVIVAPVNRPGFGIARQLLEPVLTKLRQRIQHLSCTHTRCRTLLRSPVLRAHIPLPLLHTHPRPPLPSKHVPSWTVYSNCPSALCYDPAGCPCSLWAICSSWSGQGHVCHTDRERNEIKLRHHHLLMPGKGGQGVEKQRSQNVTEITINYNNSKHLLNVCYNPGTVLSTLYLTESSR